MEREQHITIFRAFLHFYAPILSVLSLMKRITVAYIFLHLFANGRYILSGRKRVAWDVNFVDVKINIPWTNANSEPYAMVIFLFSIYESYCCGWFLFFCFGSAVDLSLFYFRFSHHFFINNVFLSASLRI